MKKGLLEDIEEQIGKAWKAFCDEYEDWEARLLDCEQDDALSLREWRLSKPEFDNGIARFLLREIASKLRAVIYYDDGKYVHEQDYEKGYVFYKHRIVVGGELVGYIHEKYYDDGTYTLDIEEINHEKAN